MNHYRPYSVNIEITLACNLRCKHCGSTAGHPRSSELTFDELVQCFRELRSLGGEEVCLLGGEPLVRRDWEELGKAAGDAGLDLVLITNGMLVDEPTAARIAALPTLHRIGVSLDAADPDVHDAMRGRRGSHGRSVRALHLLRDAGLEVGAITTVSRTNFGELPGLRDLLLGQLITWQIQIATVGGERFDGSDRLSVEEFYEVGRFVSECRSRYSPQELPVAGAHDIGYCSEVLGPTGELPEWHGCGAGLYTLGIMSDGRVKGCLSEHDDLVEASIRERSLADIWNDPQAFRRNRGFERELLQGFCRTCPHGATCRAGCLNTAYTVTGRLYDNPYCFYRIEREAAARPDRLGGLEEEGAS